MPAHTSIAKKQRDLQLVGGELALHAEQPFLIARLDQLVHEGGGRREMTDKPF